MDQDRRDPIAIVGVSFGLPAGATTSDTFWKMMMEKRNASQDFPASRLNIDQIYHPDPNRKGQVSFLVFLCSVFACAVVLQTPPFFFSTELRWLTYRYLFFAHGSRCLQGADTF